jgi:hypothetical protein
MTTQAALGMPSRKRPLHHWRNSGFPSPARVEIERSVYGKIAWRY